MWYMERVCAAHILYGRHKAVSSANDVTWMLREEPHIVHGFGTPLVSDVKEGDINDDSAAFEDLTTLSNENCKRRYRVGSTYYPAAINVL